MKQRFVLTVLYVVLLAAAGQASAATKGTGGVAVDGSLVFATAPESSFDSTVGIGVGATIDLSERINTSRNVAMSLRGDMTYFAWDGDVYGIDLTYKRLAFFGGPRLYFPLGGKSAITPYVEGGLELTYDTVDVALPPFNRTSRSELNLGLAGGGGVEFALADRLKFGVSGRVHIISDSFLSLGVSLGYAF